MLKFGNIYFLKSFRGSEIDIIYILRQSFKEIIETNETNGIVQVSTSNVKLFLETILSG